MNPASLSAMILGAEKRIRPHVRETQVVRSESLAEATGAASVHLKCEHQQHTGSFKFRGALNRLLVMPEAQRARGVVAASTGNHGLAVARAAQILGHSASIFHPEGASEAKLSGIRDLGATTRAFGQDCVECEGAARAYAQGEGLQYLSPYNDVEVVAGQGTLGVELERQLDGVDAVFVSVGGGGLVAGLGTWMKRWRPAARVFGCSPVNSAVLLRSLEAGELLELESLPTLSDATAGGVEAGSVTFDISRRVVDERVFVTEEEIGAALTWMVRREDTVVEGAAAAALAGFLQRAPSLAGKRVLIVLCGANIAPDVLAPYR